MVIFLNLILVSGLVTKEPVLANEPFTETTLPEIYSPNSDMNEEMLTTFSKTQEQLLDAVTDYKNLDSYIKSNKKKIEQIDEVKRRRLLSIFQMSVNDFLLMDLRTPSNMTVEHLDSILKGTELYGLGKSYKKAEEVYDVNALALTFLTVHESEWGRSRFAKERNNIAGHKAYDSNPDAAQHFSTKEECIMTVAKNLSKNYLVPNGKWFNGYNLQGVNHYYASDDEWAIKIARLMYNSIKKQL